MARPTRLASLLALLALTGCLPAPATPGTTADSGSNPDTGADLGRDVGADTGPECEVIADVTAWCAERDACGAVARPGCPDVPCDSECPAGQTCVGNTCECVEIDVAAACADAMVVCGPLERTTCDGTQVTCNLCANFETCSTTECTLPSLEPDEDFIALNEFRLGVALAYGAGSLLMTAGRSGNADNVVYSLALQTNELVDLAGTASPPNPTTFGQALDIEGDYAIIGSPAEGFTSSGTIHLFQRIADTWAPLANEMGENTIEDPLARGDQFATQIAIDYPYFAASDPEFSDGPASELRGRVHVWRHDGDAFEELDWKLWNPTGDDKEPFRISQYGSSLDMGDGMLFVGAVKAFNEVNKVCGAVRVLFLDESAAGEPVFVDLRDDDCLSQDDGISSKVVSSNFGQEVFFDGEHLFVSAPRYDLDSTPGALYVFEYDAAAADPENRFINPQRIVLPLIDGILIRDTTWRITRAGDAIVIGLNDMGRSPNPEPDEPGLLFREGLIAIVREDTNGSWQFEEYWAPDDFAGKTYQFGADVAGTPEGKVYVSAPSATTLTGPGDRAVTRRGVVLELDLTRR